MRQPSHARGFASRVCAAAWAALVALSAPSLDAHAAPRAVEFDIPAGTLADSLDQFGEQSGLQVVYDFALIGDRSASALVGVMPPREALDRFLAGSGLAWSFVNDGTVVLRRATPERAPRRRAPSAGAPKFDDEGNALTGLTVVASPHAALPTQPSGASGFEKSALATPRSVSLVSVETIDLLGLSAVEDLVRVVPGAYTTTRWGIQGSIDIRNVPADTYFRGMKRINLQGHGRSVLAAMETIEIVKGPPPPIYGMGKIGGYTNMVPKSMRAATGGYLSAPHGFVQAMSGSYDKSEMSFGVGGPLPLEHEQGGYYVYGLFEDSGTFIEQVPVGQRVVQGAVSVDDVIGKFRLEAGLNLQRSRTAGALIGRFTQAAADSGRYVRGTPLVELDANGNGRIGYLEMYGGSPVQGATTSGNQALRQYFAWPTSADGTPLDGSPPVPGIPASLYDYLTAHPETDPTGLLRAQGRGGPQPISGFVPAGFALDPRTVGFDELDLRQPGAFERDLQADFVTGYFDLVNDADPNVTIKNQLFVDSMDQYKISEQPYSQRQDVYVVEDKLTISRRLTSAPSGVDVNSLVSVNVRRTSAKGFTGSGDYATHRGDAMSAAADAGPKFATAYLNPDVDDDGMPWTSHYATESSEIGAGLLFDITLHGNTNVIAGARVDRSHAANVDYAGTLNLSAGTATEPAVFRTADARVSGRDSGVSWSVSVQRRLPNGLRPYLTYAEESLALDENNNKYDNDVLARGHIGRARLVEAGVKAALLDERLFVSAAIYDQARVGVADDDEPAVLDAHVSATTTRGFEAELKWEAADNLLLSLYGLHQRTQFTPNVGANIMVDARALGFSDVVDANGNVVYPAEAFLYGGRSFVVLPPGVAEYSYKQGNPDVQLGMLAEYALNERVGFTLSGNYFSSVYSGRLRLVELPEAYVLNVGFFWELNRWQLKYDALNVLDERYFRARTGDTLGDQLVSAMPGRRWQVTLRTRF